MHNKPNRNHTDFIKLPKDLFRMERYNQVSALAKLLYGFLADRASLSARNGDAWMDEHGEFFVHFTIVEITQRLGCGHDKAAALLRELEQAGLIKRSLMGRGRPYRIVVKPLINAWEPPLSTLKTNVRGIDNLDANNTDKNKTEINQTNSITGLERASVTMLIQRNICYEVLLERLQKSLLDGIVDIIVETICTQTSTVMIAGVCIPRSEVRQRFLELDQMDICYVHDMLMRETKDVHYLRKYILARLYEAKNWSDYIYGRWVDQDMRTRP